MKVSKKMIIGFVTPAVLMFLVVFLYPIIRTIMMSFFYIPQPTTALSEWEFTGIDNFVRLFNTQVFITSLKNIWNIWFIGGIIVLSLSLLFGIILTSGIRGKKFFRAVIYLPNIVSAVALATMWQQYVFSNRFGLLKSIFDFLGLEELANYPWLGVDQKFWSLLIAYSFGMVGYHMLIWMSGIERIGADYYEAARIDGANLIKQFQHITWPLLRGVLKTNVTMWTVSTGGFFVWSQLFTSVNAGENVLVPVQYMYMQIFGATSIATETNAGYGAAIGIIICVFIVAVFTICNRTIKNDDLEF